MPLLSTVLAYTYCCQALHRSHIQGEGKGEGCERSRRCVGVTRAVLQMREAYIAILQYCSAYKTLLPQRNIITASSELRIEHISASPLLHIAQQFLRQIKVVHILSRRALFVPFEPLVVNYTISFQRYNLKKMNSFTFLMHAFVLTTPHVRNLLWLLCTKMIV